MPFNFSASEFLNPHKKRKNLVSPVSRASPAHMNSPLDPVYTVPDPHDHDIILVSRRIWLLNLR